MQTRSRTDDPLAKYNEMRDFRRTKEPPGRRAPKQATLSYCVQKHAATRLHYDFRLELDGVLKSWAVPRGPSLDPKDRRLAVQTEDHPVDYGDFEGVIAEGEYGGGTVLLWDRGTWEPIGDPHAGLEKGKLEFLVHGEKLAGRFILVRLKDTDSEWLLFKGNDEHVRKGDLVVEELPRSVASGRYMDDIATEEGGTQKQIRRAAAVAGRRKAKTKMSSRATAQPSRPAAKATRAARATKKKATRTKSTRDEDAAPLPDFVPSQLATLVTEPPVGEVWIHEIKLDGYRLQCRIDGDDVRWVSRNGNDWSDRLPHLSKAMRELGAEQALLDGELVHIDEHGVTSFQRVANAVGGPGARALVFHVFDVLFLDGRDLRREPLLERKRVLEQLCRGAPASIRYTDHVVGRGNDFLREACKLGLEGIVSKRAEGPYRSGRGRDWLKIKCLQRQEFVIVGWTPPTHASDRLGSLVLAVNDGGDLVYAGRVGTGFDRATRADLRQRLDELAVDRSPLASKPRAPGLRDTQWVAPELVAEVAFTEWTDDGRLRHPTFRGLREDKRPAAVVRERPAATPTRTDGDPVVAGVAISNPDKVLYAEQGITKLEIARYYEAIAHFILPHLHDRPLMLRRCPDGPSKPCFYQKHAGMGLPSGIRTFDVEEDDGKTAVYLAVDDLEGLVGAVQLGGLELHIWGSRRDRIEIPDRMVIDLDPDPSVNWHDVKAAALDVRERLEALELESFVMVTGGKGLHVVVPLQRVHDFDDVKSFSRALAERMVADEPRRYVAQATKNKRTGRIFVDYLRNGRGATAVCPYSTRARVSASVAMPIEWRELAALEGADVFDIRSARDRLARRRKDAWAGYGEVKQRLTAGARRKLESR